MINWSRGLVFEQVQADLENEGYEVTSVILPACSKDASHRRERIWFVAHDNGHGFNNGWRNKTEGRERQSFDKINSQTYANHDGQRVQRQLSETIQGVKRIKRGQTFEQLTDSFRRSDTFEPKLCRTLHGLPFGVDRIRGLGNAIVPQVAYEIFKVIDYLLIPSTL